MVVSLYIALSYCLAGMRAGRYGVLVKGKFVDTLNVSSAKTLFLQEVLPST
jgi:peroxiredoxin